MRGWRARRVDVTNDVLGRAVNLPLRGAQVVDEALDLGGGAARGGEEGDVGGEEREGEG